MTADMQDKASVTVKPLDWEETEACSAAYTIVGRYRAADGLDANGRRFLPPAWRAPDSEQWIQCESLDEGKAAAQADYERRILSALSVEKASAVETPSPVPHLEGPQPCGIADPSTRDCPNMKEVGGGMDGERYRCAVCGKGYFLDYEEMK